MEQNNEILEGVLDEFNHLAAIPRQSGHEQAVSDFLKKYLTDAGFAVIQDEKNNIIADKPASKHRLQPCRGIWIWFALQKKAIHSIR